MSGYEVEHNISTKEEKPEQPSRRPDLSTFFSTLEQVDTSDAQAHHNAHALPQPEQTAAAFRLLANAFEVMRGDTQGQVPDSDGQAHTGSGENELLESMIDLLRQSADDPPVELNGCPNSFLDELERVNKNTLKATDKCPICVTPFLDDKYPLVVRLPCHKNHQFDLDCIGPWLKLNSTCPFCRKEIYKKKQPPPPVVDDEEEDYDEMFA